MGAAPDADGDGVGALVEASVVELHAAVVQVHAVDQLRVALVLLHTQHPTLAQSFNINLPDLSSASVDPPKRREV